MIDLLHYADTCHVNYDDCLANGYARYGLSTIGVFTDLILSFFLAKLHSQRAVVSGSVVLHVLLNISFSGVQHAVDVHCLAAQRHGYFRTIRWGLHPSSQLVRHQCLRFRAQGDCPSITEGSSRLHALPRCEGHHLSGSRKSSIYVVMSASEFSIAPILRFHCSVVYDFIMGKGLFSAYPGMTGRYRGVVNPYQFTVVDCHPPLPGLLVRQALAKYEARCSTSVSIIHVGRTTHIRVADILFALKQVVLCRGLCDVSMLGFRGGGENTGVGERG